MTHTTSRKRLMWDEYFKRWVDLFFWWMPRKDSSSKDETTPEAPRERTGEAAAPRPKEAPAAPPRPPERTPERPRPAESAARAEPPEATPPAGKAPAPDDLTQIKGIGPALQEKLRGLGITTFGQLAAADPEQLTEQLKGTQPISKARVREWTRTARKRAGSRA